MVNASQQVIDRLNELTMQRFGVQVTIDDNNRKYKEFLARFGSEHAKELQELQTQINALDAQIWETLNTNRDSLIVHGKRSFATMTASFQLRKLPAKLKVIDAEQAMAIARKHGFVKKVAKLSVKWVFNAAKFTDWLSRHGEQREIFAECIEDTEASESLTIKPNTTHAVYYDGRRISPPSITIQKS